MAMRSANRADRRGSGFTVPLRHLVCLVVLSAATSIACPRYPAPSSGGPPRRSWAPGRVATAMGYLRPVADHAMANVVQDPKQHPEAIVGDFSTPNPLVTFKPEDIAFTTAPSGSSATGRNRATIISSFPRSGTSVTKSGVPITSAWHRLVGAALPRGAESRPTGPLCDGCHSVNYDIKTHAVTEWNVGCERCHGAGARTSRVR